MEKYSLFLKDGIITIQEADYIEDGFFIKIVDEHIYLYQIPLGGGEEVFINEFKTIKKAIEEGKKLT